MAQATPIYESATLGPVGATSGASLSGQFLGSRFTVTGITQVTSIGGHMLEFGGNETLWGAIIPMTGLLPTFLPSLIETNVLGSAIFTPTNASNDFFEPLSVTLPPGDYALVFGGNGFFSTTGFGAMPLNNTNTPEGVGSYFFSNQFFWFNAGFDRARFVVVGIPEPSTFFLLGAGLLSYGWRRRKH